MRGLAPVLATLVVAVSTPAHALRTAHLQELGAAIRATEDPSKTDVTALPSGGYVAAWDRWDGECSAGATATVYDAYGEIARQISCPAPPRRIAGTRLSLSPVGEGFVFGCDLIRLDAPPWSTVRVQRFSSTGEAMEEAIVIDDALINQAPRLVPRDDDSWIVAWERCDGLSCLETFAIQATAGQTIDRFPIPRLLSVQLALNDDGQFLAIGSGRMGTRGRVSVFARRLDDDGRLLGPVTRITRAKIATPFQVTSGRSGRTAASWSSLDRSGLSTVYVRTFDPLGVPAAANVPIPFPAEVFGTVTPALALPLDDGFLLMWTQSTEHWDDPVLTYSYKTFVQEFRPDGTAIGEPLRLPGDPRAITSVAYREYDDSFLVLGVSEHRPDGADQLELYRVGREPRCGDTDGDERVTAFDAQRILRATAGEGGCDPCRCDVDGSGVIDEADSTAAVWRAISGDSGDCPVCPED